MKGRLHYPWTGHIHADTHVSVVNELTENNEDVTPRMDQRIRA